MTKARSNEWAIIGLNEDESHVVINEIEYTMQKNSAAIVHAIMCLVDAMDEVGEKIQDIEISMKRKK